MAEQANKTTSRIFDSIRAKFAEAGMKPAEISKFQAVVSIVPCEEGAKCWETIACQREIVIPTLDREMIEVDTSDACTIFEGGQESWKQFVPDKTRFMSEWTQEVYFTPEQFDIMLEASGADQPYIIVIEVNDSRRTQFAFLGHLKTLDTTFVANTDSDVSMMPTTWQPTGRPFVTSGVELKYCNDESVAFGRSKATKSSSTG